MTTQIITTNNQEKIEIQTDTIEIVRFDNRNQRITYHAQTTQTPTKWVQYQRQGVIDDIDTKLRINNNPIMLYYQACIQNTDHQNDTAFKQLLFDTVHDCPDKFFTGKGNWQSTLVSYQFHSIEKIVRQHFIQKELLAMLADQELIARLADTSNQSISRDEINRVFSYHFINDYIPHATDESNIGSGLRQLLVQQKIIKVDHSYMLANQTNDKQRLSIKLKHLIDEAQAMNIPKTVTLLKQAQTQLKQSI